MEPNVKTELEMEEPSEFHKQMLIDTKALLTISRQKMKEYYPTWRKNDEVYRAIRQRDAEDIAAGDRKEPEKMVVPISFAQILTFVTFCYSLYMQRDRFFELEGFTAEDDKPSKIGEALLARDLNKNCFEALLFQFLLDIGRFGVGIFKTSWSTEYGTVENQVTTPAKSFLGVQLAPASTQTVRERGITYEGNRISNISPFRFFPDVRLPLVRFQEGEFCASEELYSNSQLKSWQADGVCAGVKYIKPITKDINRDDGFEWDNIQDPVGAVGAGMKGDGQAKRMVVVTEVQRNLIPSEYTINDEPLGEEDYPVKYVIWIANDTRIIKCEPLVCGHDQFTYSVAPFIFDNNTLLPNGLADVIDQLQSVISWFLNARITNVRKVIGDKLIVNPAMVNMSDLQNRRPIIRLTAAAAGEIDRYIKQLQMSDVTATHVRDVKELHDILKMVTGITDSLLGEVRPGRRSATENRNSTTGAATRLKTVAAVIFRFALESMGRQMLGNLRYGLDNETYVKILGQKAQQVPDFIKVDKNALQGHYDFEIFDGTLPSDRQHTAQALEEVFGLVMANPQTAVTFNIDPRKVLEEMMLLRGVRNFAGRFDLNPADQQQLNANITAASGQPAGPKQPAPNGPGGAPSGVPNSIPESVLPLLAGAARNGGGGGNL